MNFDFLKWFNRFGSLKDMTSFDKVKKHLDRIFAKRYSQFDKKTHMNELTMQNQPHSQAGNHSHFLRANPIIICPCHI